MARPNWQTIAEKLNRTMAPAVFVRTLGILLGVALVGITMLIFAIPTPAKVSKVIISDETAGHLELLTENEAASPVPPVKEETPERATAEDTHAPPPNQQQENPPEEHTEAAISTPPTTQPEPLPTEPAKVEATTQEVADADAPVRSDVEDAIAGLYETTSYGPLPIKRLTDGKTAFDLYRPPFERHQDSHGIIALVMVDYGLSDKISAKAITTLPSAISMVASPYARMIQPKVTGARAYGHEVWLQIPIQDANFGLDDPGPITLLSGIKKEQNLIRLKSTLGRATGYVGLTVINAPDFSMSADGIDFLFSFMDERGLAFSSAAPNDTMSAETAARFPVPFGRSNLWLNESHDYKELNASLKAIENIATKDGVAIAYFYPSPKIIETLTQWQKTLATKKIQLAPLSATIEAKVKH